jgi:xylulokinase
LLFLPYMAGERTPLWNSRARGVFFGASYTTTEGDFYRAIMEGCAFSVYHNLVLAREHGVDVDVWLGNGGAASSDLWCQIKADVSGRPFMVRTLADGHQGGHTLGLFALIAKAVGLGDSISGVVDRLLVRERRFDPDPIRYAAYQQFFSLYLSLVDSLLPEFDRLAEIQEQKGHT